MNIFLINASRKRSESQLFCLAKGRKESRFEDFFYHFLVQVVLLSELKRCADEMASTDLTMQAIQEVLDLHNGACLAADMALICQ